MDYAEALHKIETWDGRLFRSIKLPPWQTGLCLFLILAAFYFVSVGILNLPALDNLYHDAFPFWHEVDTVVIVCLVAAYTYASEIYVQRGNLEDIKALIVKVPENQYGNDISNLVNRLSRRARIATLVGTLIGLTYVFLFTGSGVVLVSKGKIEVFVVFAFAVFPFLFGRTAKILAVRNPLLVLFRHQYGDAIQIDVLERDAYRPFVRIGLRAALRWLVLFAILTVLLIDEGNNRTMFGQLPMVFLLVTMSVIVATIEFLIPLLAARQLIKREKERETEWVVQATKEMRSVLKASSADPTARTSRLSDLLAYKRELDSMSDWPVDLPDIGRFFVYLLIPVLSWFGGAGAQIMLEGLLQ